MLNEKGFLVFLQLLAIFLPLLPFAQIVNGSFENKGGADLTGWQWICPAESASLAPPGGGGWCIKVAQANPKGCIRSFAYQKLPGIVTGQTYLLSCYAFREVTFAGIYFGKIRGGVNTLQEGDSTVSDTWTKLTVQSSFDLVTLAYPDGTPENESFSKARIYPNPFNSHAILDLLSANPGAGYFCEWYDASGQLISRNSIPPGKTMIGRKGMASGIYFLRILQNGIPSMTERLIIMD